MASGTPGIYNPPINQPYRHLDVSHLDNSIIYAAMGENGTIFKAITHQTGLTYIWFLEAERRIEFWGPEKRMDEAIARVITRIQMVRQNEERKKRMRRSSIPEAAELTTESPLSASI